MAAHIPHSVPLSPGGLGVYCHWHDTDSLPLQSVIAYLSALYKHSPQDLILLDPSQVCVGPLRLSSLIPPDFPLYFDSIIAELFSQDIKSSYPSLGNLIDMLDNFRKKIVFAHRGNMNRAPTTYSVTRVVNFNHIPIQFGVSAPSKTKTKMAEQVRYYRVLQCWGKHKPPRKSETWKHGQCAENQSLPSVVAQCAALDLENVIIETLALNNKTGRLVCMCGNCQAYVSRCILRRHPTWKVIDRSVYY